MKHPLGTTVEWKDRTGAADFNGDGRPDIVVTEESVWKGDSVYWFENPSDPTFPNWPRHTLVTQFTTNSLDVADMNNDGRPDIITAEHRGTKKLQIWENLGGGNFREHIISTGRENHLEARNWRTWMATAIWISSALPGMATHTSICGETTPTRFSEVCARFTARHYAQRW